jgi:hypothetical protein
VTTCRALQPSRERERRQYQGLLSRLKDEEKDEIFLDRFSALCSKLEIGLARGFPPSLWADVYFSQERTAELKTLQDVFHDLIWAWDPDVYWCGYGITTYPFQLHIALNEESLVWRILNTRKMGYVAEGAVVGTLQAALPVVRAFWDELHA